jgi:lysophospholipase
VERFAARLKTGLALVLPGSKHEIVHETDDIRDKFWTAFDAFIPGEMTPLIAPKARTMADDANDSAFEHGEGSLMDAPVTGSDDAPATRS